MATKRLIDARYLTSQMYMICEVCQTENIFIDAIIDEIDNAPDVDAVEVVRCKDCMWFDTEDELADVFREERHCFCTEVNGYVSEKHYCSYGERKDNG